MRFRRAATLGASAAIAALGVVPSWAAATFPGRNGRITYADSAAGVVWTARLDGSGRRRVLNHSRYPKWSPDGGQLVFLRGADVARSRRDGSDVTRVVRTATIPHTGQNPWLPDTPGFSPDGRRIVFQATSGDTDLDNVSSIFTVAIDGTDLQRIYSSAPPMTAPVWSPDGRTIWFIRGSVIASIRPDGSGYRERFTARRPVTKLDFSPGGQRLLFFSVGAKNRINVLTPHTREVHRISTRITGNVWDATWSPEGRSIAYLHYPPLVDGPQVVFPRGEIYTIQPDGSRKRLRFVLPPPRARLFNPDFISWQPRPR